MKKILLVVLILMSYCSVAQQKKPTNTKDTLTWKGKSISRKSLEDSLRVTFFKNCDCLDTIKKKEKINQFF